MRYSNRYFYENRLLSPGELKKAIISTASLLPEPKKINIRIDQVLADGTHTFTEDLTVDHLETVLELDSQALEIVFRSNEGFSRLSVDGSEKYLKISASSDRADLPQALVRHFSDALTLKPAHPEMEEDRIGELTKRVESLEARITPRKERLKCFLSYRFDPAVEALAQKLVDRPSETYSMIRTSL